MTTAEDPPAVPPTTIPPPPATAVPEEDESRRKAALTKSKEYLGMGVGIGAVGLASAALLGATCPLCVVAAPAFIGLGVVKRWQARRR
jgi:hypothetical protein